MRDIEKMLQDIADPKFGASEFLGSYRDSTGRSLKEYRLPKDLTMTLITGYRADLRYKVVKRVEELEARPTALPDFTNPAEAARAWADQVETAAPAPYSPRQTGGAPATAPRELVPAAKAASR